MDRISGEALTIDDMQSGIGAYKLGKIMGKISRSCSNNSAYAERWHDDQDLGYACTMARLLSYWPTVDEFSKKAALRAPPPRLEFAPYSTVLLSSCLNRCVSWARQFCAALGRAHHFCYLLGMCHEWPSCSEQTLAFVRNEANQLLARLQANHDTLPEHILGGYLYVTHTIDPQTGIGARDLQFEMQCFALAYLASYEPAGDALG